MKVNIIEDDVLQRVPIPENVSEEDSITDRVSDCQTLWFQKQQSTILIINFPIIKWNGSLSCKEDAHLCCESDIGAHIWTYLTYLTCMVILWSNTCYSWRTRTSSQSTQPTSTDWNRKLSHQETRMSLQKNSEMLFQESLTCSVFRFINVFYVCAALRPEGKYVGPGCAEARGVVVLGEGRYNLLLHDVQRRWPSHSGTVLPPPAGL